MQSEISPIRPGIEIFAESSIQIAAQIVEVRKLLLLAFC